MILRYLLNDDSKMAEKAEEYLNRDAAAVTTEVIAEAVYVLSGFYHMERDRIAETVIGFLTLVRCRDRAIVRLALETYGCENLDFVDCVLYAYHRLEGAKVATFVRKPLRLLNKQN